MFWRMAGLSTASAVEAILDKDGFTLEDLLDEDELIQECKALNGRLLNFLRERVQVEQLIRYIIEEPPEDVENKRTFKFPFIACEIFTCEIEMILKTLVEDEELMLLLFSFLEAKETHNSLLAGYFSKVVICLLVRKTIPFMQFIKDHQEILKQLVDLIGITSIMEVLKRLVGTDEHLYANYTSAMQWVEDTDILEMIVDKFGSSDCPEVHANVAEILCTVARYAPPGLATKLSSPSCTGRLLKHTLEDSRPKSVLVNSLSVCISLLDPKRFTLGTYPIYGRQLTLGSMVPNPETVEGMLGSLGDLLVLLNVSSSEGVLLTTYGKLQPPLGKHRLKVVEFISVLLTVGSEAAEKEVIRLGAVKRVLDLFFEYPYNNFLHHHVENVILSCLESKNSQLLDHLLSECNLIGSILEAEKDSILTAADSDKPTVPAEGRKPLRIGNIGHLTRISNKLLQLANSNAEIQSHLQENSKWVDWHTDVLSKRNTLENVYSWACGRPSSLHDRNRDSDDDDYHDRDYDVAALANNLSQAFRYGMYSNDDMEETQGSMERDDEDVYFDDESAEVVISSLRLGDDQESSSLFTNSNWFAFDDEKTANEGSMASPPPNADEDDDDDDDVVIGEADEDFKDTVDSSPPVDMETEDSTTTKNPSENPSEPEAEKSAAWVEWREKSESTGPSSNPDEATTLPNGEVQIEKEDDEGDDTDKKSAEDSAIAGACSDETAEKSPEAASGDEIAEELKDSGPDASELAAAESHENAQSSEPAITQETKKSHEEDVAAEIEEAVKEEEKVV
ncbi:serine/threonine-protein phosphatase 6 regulatory subunit 3 isoform X3 [Brassica rapa]|uniref:serine/threonine-protein phosphatase 6 regulatory subunit 3 isoform X3 n=1 Tax=Brassica campestris TaxID=3711 RepID=UPI00142D6845|nr:serine/threonine-protein phosphatase 6 regulatory subunit 3 isoform X3 [Brassica rapa]XP_022544417.2 serine/threonine-protein phosphatase 6 regulatory subunit 3 isoform X3 [Brassica napus]